MNADLIEELRTQLADRTGLIRDLEGHNFDDAISAIRALLDALAAKDAALSKLNDENATTFVNLSTKMLEVAVERDKAEAALSEMRAELDRARNALEPFAAARGHFDGHVRDDDVVSIALRDIRAHHVFAAARALASQDEGEER